MKNIKWRKAYTQVLEILNHIPAEEYSKIPKEEIKYFEDNKDKDYDYKFNPNVDLAEQNISKEANAIIVKLFMDYFATEEQKNKIDEILIDNQKMIEKRRDN